MKRSDGKGTTRQSLDDKPCPDCGRTGSVYYLGSDVDTEPSDGGGAPPTTTEDWFICSACGEEWSEITDG